MLAGMAFTQQEREHEHDAAVSRAPFTHLREIATSLAQEAAATGSSCHPTCVAR